jgi:dCTP deaminase
MAVSITAFPGILPDHEIRRLAAAGMIKRFREDSRQAGKISFGLQPLGYDVRLAPELLVLRQEASFVDPKRLARHHYERLSPRRDGTLLLPPRAFALGRTIETISLPHDITALVLNVPAVLHPSEGIAQVLFFRSTAPPEADYAARGGLYQGQQGITPPRIKSK